jgi:RNA polymerase sigma-70 factor (ECF subfamily)
VTSDDACGTGVAQPDFESTRALLDRVRSGEEEARNQLIARFLPGLKRWARGRLPGRAREMVDTDDLVQISLIRALARVDEFEAGRAGAFLSYLHRILLNCMRDEIRRVERRPARESLDDDVASPPEYVLERTVGRSALETYEKALEALTEDQRQAVILRIEFGFTYEEIARALGRPSANAVRMQIARSLVRLTEAMDDYR